MLSSRRLPSVVLFLASALLALVTVPVAHAAAKPAHVQASLVAADTSVKPGQPITVALRLVHNEHWHTYWLNPGTGLATSLSWKLPAGWTASEIQWPAPLAIRDKTGVVTGNGYEGDLLLPVTLTPPANLAPGTTVELKASADWLMCAEICVPGNADVALTLPVSADAPKPDAAFGEKIRATVAGLPRADAAWKLTATRTGKTVTLQVTPTGPATAASPEPKLHFFSDDGVIAFEEPQTTKSDGKGGFVITLPISAEAPKDAAKLLGVLTTSGSWLPSATLRGLRVDLPFAAAAAPVATSSLTPSTPAASAPTSLIGTLFLALVGGLILNLMPCVFPVLGIKILGFVIKPVTTRKRS